MSACCPSTALHIETLRFHAFQVVDPKQGFMNLLSRLVQVRRASEAGLLCFAGCTEEICVHILERLSGLRYATDTPLAAKGQHSEPSPTGRGQGEGQTQDLFHLFDHSPERPDVAGGMVWHEALSSRQRACSILQCLPDAVAHQRENA